MSIPSGLKKTERLSRKTLVKTPRLYLHEDLVEFATGNQSIHWKVDYQRHGVGVVPKLNDGRILLGLHYRYCTETWGWEIVAGSIDLGEDRLQTAHREIMEETGHKAGSLKFLMTYNPAPGLGNETFHIYLGTELEQITTRLDADEIYETRPFSWTEIQKMIEAGEMTDGFSITALSYCKAVGLI